MIASEREKKFSAKKALAAFGQMAIKRGKESNSYRRHNIKKEVEIVKNTLGPNGREEEEHLSSRGD